MREFFELAGALAAVIGLIAIVIAPFAAWITHIIWWIKLLMNEEMDTFGELFLALAGVIFVPIGMVHGVVIWFA